MLKSSTTTFFKEKRIKDPELLATVRKLHCMGCGMEGPGAIHAHHVIPRGAGGGDIATNVMPLCGACHYKIHFIGHYNMAQEHMVVKHWLKFSGNYARIKEKNRRLYANSYTSQKSQSSKKINKDKQSPKEDTKEKA